MHAAPPYGRVDLLSILEKKCRSERRLAAVLERTNAELGVVGPSDFSNVLAGVALIKFGEDPEMIARELSWTEFEDFCANILRASGFQVARNVMLKKPRRQIDIVARSAQLNLSIDCKHWRRSVGGAALHRMASDQLSRTNALAQSRSSGEGPLASLILTLAPDAPRFVGGVAVVPLFLLRSFLNSFYEFRDSLALV